mmetsp:Transcript_42160/g.126235  ORF Transcript_42160/g.126235 Transcript_42160/m.126235 type:complete len:312 (+) Transcript_42160:1383-2318(+)
MRSKAKPHTWLPAKLGACAPHLVPPHVAAPVWAHAVRIPLVPKLRRAHVCNRCFTEDTHRHAAARRHVAAIACQHADKCPHVVGRRDESICERWVAAHWVGFAPHVVHARVAHAQRLRHVLCKQLAPRRAAGRLGDGAQHLEADRRVAERRPGRGAIKEARLLAVATVRVGRREYRRRLRQRHAQVCYHELLEESQRLEAGRRDDARRVGENVAQRDAANVVHAGVGGGPPRWQVLGDWVVDVKQAGVLERQQGCRHDGLAARAEAVCSVTGKPVLCGVQDTARVCCDAHAHSIWVEAGGPQPRVQQIHGD